MSWRRTAIKEVNDWALKVHISLHIFYTELEPESANCTEIFAKVNHKKEVVGNTNYFTMWNVKWIIEDNLPTTSHRRPSLLCQFEGLRFRFIVQQSNCRAKWNKEYKTTIIHTIYQVELLQMMCDGSCLVSPTTLQK